MVKWDPKQLQRLVGDSELAPGCENPIDSALVGNQCYQPGFCTWQAARQTFYAQVHSRTVIFLDLAMSENLAEGGRM